MAATVSLTSHAKPLAALVGDPDPAHTLEGEQRTVTLLHAATLGHAQVKAAKCARLTMEPTLGPPSFLHGAAMIVGERSHLEGLARAYGFRPQAQRRAEDEACCLLVVPLPSTGMYGYGGTPGAASKASMRAQAVAGRFLELLAAAHGTCATSTPKKGTDRRCQDDAYVYTHTPSCPSLHPTTHTARGPGKREPNRVEHHLRTALCALTREGVLRALGHGTMLAEPAILAMGQVRVAWG